jgi:hypothetical protein
MNLGANTTQEQNLHTSLYLRLLLYYAALQEIVLAISDNLIHAGQFGSWCRCRPVYHLNFREVMIVTHLQQEWYCAVGMLLTRRGDFGFWRSR